MAKGKLLSITDRPTLEALMERALTDWSNALPLDKLTPGLLLSRLRDGTYYAAVHRFMDEGEREVVATGRGKSLVTAIANLKQK
jgi:hypothetical protein